MFEDIKDFEVRTDMIGTLFNLEIVDFEAVWEFVSKNNPRTS